MLTRLARSFEDEPQPLLNQIPELAAAQRRLRLGSTVQLVRDFNGGLHSNAQMPWNRKTIFME